MDSSTRQPGRDRLSMSGSRRPGKKGLRLQLYLCFSTRVCFGSPWSQIMGLADGLWATRSLWPLMCGVLVNAKDTRRGGCDASCHASWFLQAQPPNPSWASRQGSCWRCGQSLCFASTSENLPELLTTFGLAPPVSNPCLLK